MTASADAQPFNEAFYVQANPDVAAAVAAGVFANGREHFVRNGFAEGRIGSPSAADERAGFDEQWYLDAHPDVAEAVRSGRLASGYDHWREYGANEARLTPPGFGEAGTGDNAGTAGWEEADRAVASLLHSAALRNLPFLPGEIADEPAGIRVSGVAGAPEGLTKQMAFYLNGRRLDDVEYPIADPSLAVRFSEAPGMRYMMRGRLTHDLAAVRSERWWRFDAAPTGHFVPADWRRAIHFMNPAFERFPFPPAANMRRVIGDDSTARFAMGGATIFSNITRYLAELDRTWTDFPNVLDWGCGAGRVTRYLISETSSAVTGIDIDPDNIAWCQGAYPGARFEATQLRPPTPLRDGAFDLITGLSVLTHLSEHVQFVWLAELRRISRPGALLFLSVQGPTQFAYNRFAPKLYRRLQRDGFLDVARDGALDAVVSDKDYYRAAMHSRAYIVEKWAEFFEVVAIVDAIAGLQDFVVLRRRMQ